MNFSIHKTVLATALAAFIPIGAVAQEAMSDRWMQPVAALQTSRAQVQQELAAARADGTISAVSAGYDFVRRAPAIKSRAQVQAELLQARSTQELAAIDREAHDFRAAPRRPVYAQR
jgi:hypothetical protein